MKAYNLSDYELVKRFISGKQSSFEILINRYKNKVYTYIFLIVKNQELAEDLFQDTFIKVMHSLKKGKYEDNGRFVSWVMRIAHNLIIDHFRKAKQLNTLSNDDYETDIFNAQKFCDENIEDRIVKNQITTDIRALVEKLPDDQKEVILLRHYWGLSFKEISEQTGVSINTALGRMRYALINLRKYIKETNLVLTVA